MDGYATRGMLGGGPPSQHPQQRSEQIRRLLPRVVTTLPQRYPQLLCACCYAQQDLHRVPTALAVFMISIAARLDQAELMRAPVALGLAARLPIVGAAIAGQAGATKKPALPPALLSLFDPRLVICA